MRLSSRALRAAALAAVFCCAAPAFGQSTPETRTGLSAAEVMAFAERALAGGDAASAIAAYTSLAADPDIDIRSEARWRHGRLLAARGDHSGAALLYRRILDERPDAGRVRLELAQTLVRLGDEAAAARQLRQAQAGGLPSALALVVNQFAGALRARQPFGGSFSFAIVPDSNINRATDAQTLDTVIAPLELSEEARAQSGIGLRTGGQAFARVRLSDSINLLPRISGEAELYRQGEFNDIALSAAIGLEINRAADRFRPSIAQSARFYGGELHSRTGSASLNWLHAIGREAQFDATVSIARADYRVNDLQDAWLFDLAAGYERAFGPRSGGAVTLNASRQAARDPGYSTAAGGASLLYWRDIGRLTVFASAGLRRLEGDARLFLFTDRRKEWLYSLAAGGTFRHFTVNGFAPLVRLSYERNASSVGIYDYRRTSVNFGITRAF